MASALLLFWKEKQTKELCAKLRFAAHPQAFPLGGRCPSAHTGADEGPIIERFFVGPDALIGPLGGSFRRGVPPCGAGYFPSDGKVPKGSPGDGSEWTLRVHIRLTPGPPIYGGYPLDVVRPFRRAKLGVLGCHSVRPHWGPEREENWDWCDFIPAPAASEPTSRGRSRRRGGPMWPPASLPPCRGKVAGLRPAG